MNRTEIFEAIRFAINRGHTLDDNILPAMRKTIIWMERNYNLSYMHRWVTFTVKANEAEPTMLPMPERIKGIEFIRFRNRVGEYTNLYKVHPQELEEEPRRAMPRGFWLDGDQHIVLESVPSENIAAEMGYWQYTDFASIGPEDEHWLFTHAEDCVVARAVMFLLPIMKAPELRALWELDLVEGLKTIYLAEETFREGPAASAQMNYVG